MNTKLTTQQTETLLTNFWDSPTYVNPYRISGNRYLWGARAANGNFLSLDKHWIQGQPELHFTPADSTWSEFLGLT